MPKRKRELSAPGPLRKSARLLERLPVQKGKKQRRGNERWRALPSPLTTESTREDRRPTQLPEKSTNDASIGSHSRETHSPSFGLGAGNKRKQEKQSRAAFKRPRLCEPTAASRNPELKAQELQLKETVPNTNVSVIESPEKPAKELKIQERHDPISYWASHHIWPENFAEHNPMALSNGINKRLRTSSYSQSCKNGEVPKQYSASYEVYIATKGLDMSYQQGQNLISEESRKTCAEFLQIEVHTIEPTAVPPDKIRYMVDDYRTRNEPIVNRDITPLIIPSIRLSYYCGASHLEHVVDEVNADWYAQCVLGGPQPRPDLAVGLFFSAFTEEEAEKLRRYTSVYNWTYVTMHMLFPFLMCEVKSREDLDIADRQNMHSCSVAVKAILRIEQEADKYRLEKKIESLNGEVLVFSISHDQEDARLYGHYALLYEEKWTYYRYRIRKFDLTDNNDLLAIHNFVRNVLKSYLPRHVRRLKDALAALPGLNRPLDSSALSGSTSGILLNDDNSQQDSLIRDADGFVVPPRPDRPKQQGQVSRLIEQIEKLMQQLEEERKKHKEEVERQRKENEEKMDKLLQRFLDKVVT